MASIKLSLRAGNTALVIHDMQNDFLKPPLGDASKRGQLLAPIQRLLHICRGLGVPVVYTKRVYGAAGLETSARAKLVEPGGPPRCRYGTWGAEVIEELKPQPRDIIVEKVRFSGFYETGLASRLRGLGIKNLVITGVATNWGVEALARDAEYRDFIPIVLSDCTAGTSPELHAASLANISLFIGFVKSSDEIITLLTSA